MMLALPKSQLLARYDAVVIGSGYGGGIAAARLARAGKRVCVLERGRQFLPQDFPTTAREALLQVQVQRPSSGRGGARRSPLGLFEVRTHADVHALVGCGLGGTSLINAGVFLEPDRRVWDDRIWPAALRDDAAGRALGFARARAVLGPSPWPAEGAFPPSRKATSLRQVGDACGARYRDVPILAHFEPPRTTENGVDERPCNGCGNCVSGCTRGAKRTVDRTYLADACGHGAHVFTETEVHHVARGGGGVWAVHFRPVVPDIEDGLPFPFVLADTVVVAAGVFGTAEILLRSRDLGLPLSAALGTQFSANGNLVGLAFGGGTTGVAQGAQAEGPGPCIVGSLEVRGDHLDDGFGVEDGAFPGALDLLVAAGALSDELSRVRGGTLLERTLSRARSVAAVVAEQIVGTPRDVQLFLVQGHDGARGRLTLDVRADRVVLAFPGYAEHARAEVAAELLRRGVAPSGGTVRLGASALPFGGAHVTVHPLGGAPMGEDHEVGVVDHLCRVFDPTKDGAVHPGLFVCDASIIPRSIGTNPVGTLCALAERAFSRLAAASEPVARTPRPAPIPHATGASFSEAFTGWLSEGPRDPGGLDAEGRVTPLATEAKLRLVVTVEDVDAFLGDPRHPASAVGTLTCALLDAAPLSVVEGKIALFSDDPAERDTYYEVYDLVLVTTSGKRFTLSAMKKFHDGGPLRVYTDGTTLPFHVEGDGRRLQGTLTMRPQSLLATIGTVSTHRTTGVRDVAAQHARFRGFFARRWMERVKVG